MNQDGGNIERGAEMEAESYRWNDRSERHEKRALCIEQIRSKNYEEIEESNRTSAPLDVSECHTPVDIPNYNIDDMLEHYRHQKEKQKINENMFEDWIKDWFKYGRRIYSYAKMKDILKERNLTGRGHDGTPLMYPIYMARYENKVTRRELRKVLTVCHVGNYVDISRDQVLIRMKKDVEDIMQDLVDDDGSRASLSVHVTDYRDQLSRWLASFPNIQTENVVPDSNTLGDPNKEAFPLPLDIMRDLTVFRKSTKEGEQFDCIVPEDGAWELKPLINDDYGDSHEVFMELVASSRDDKLDDLDMDIDGEAAWNVIERDIIKNDKITSDQEEIWKKREGRKKLNNPAWMRRRREQIGKWLISRHKLNPAVMLKYQQFYDNYEEDWKLFQELCET